MSNSTCGVPAGHAQAVDWPPSTGAGEDDWRHDVASLIDAHRRLVRKVVALSDADIETAPTEARSRETGSGVSAYVLLHDLAQHHLYHAGQIASLKKMASSP